MNNEQITNISIDIIDDPVAPIRSNLNSDDLLGLSRSIGSVGLIQPIVIKRTGERFEVIAGHRRLAASRLAGLSVLPCIIREVDEQQGDILKIHENLYREDVNVVDEAHFIRSAMERLDLTAQSFARLINRSESYVRDRLILISYDDYLLEALFKKQVGLEVAKYLSRIEDPLRRREYTEYAVKNGITTSVVQGWYEYSKENPLPSAPQDVPIEQTDGVELVEKYSVQCVYCKQDMLPGNARLAWIHKACLDVIA